MLTVDTPLALGPTLRLPWQHLLRRLRHALHEAGFDDIRASHLPVFQLLAHADARSSKLAAYAGMTKQSMGALVDELEELGYVERLADPRDGRARLVRLTEKGRCVAEVTLLSADEIEREWAALLGPREYERFRQALTALGRVLAASGA